MMDLNGLRTQPKLFGAAVMMMTSYQPMLKLVLSQE